MNKLKAIPAIRFKGFTDDWERRKVTDLLKTTKGSMKIGPFGSALKKEYYVNTGVKVYAQENIFEEDFTIGDYYITPAKYEELKSCELRPGDLVISMMGTIGACAIFPSNAEKGIMNSHLLRLQFKDGIIPEFIKLLLQDSELIKNQINRLSVGSIMNGLSSSVVQKLVFPMTSIDEQKRIVHFFGLLNHIIILHQRKLELQKRIKEYFLQNMFPDEGESVPKIRFKGFTDDWDQRKLDAVFSFLKNNTFSRADLNYESGLYKNIHYGDVLIKYGETIDVSKEKIPYINKALTVPSDAILRNGDIVMADTAEDETVGKCTEIVGAVDNKLVAGLHTIPLRPKQRFAQGYFGFYLNSEKYHNQLRPLMQGIKVTSISKSALRDTLVKFPQTEQEQSKIGMFFIRLDNIITLQQQKIEQLQSLKKFLLQNMFC